MGMGNGTYEELLSAQARSKFVRLLDVPQALFDQAFHKDGAALTKAYYRHQGFLYGQAEMADKFNKASLTCITGIAIPLAVPFMMAMVYSRWTIQKTMKKEWANLRQAILSLSPSLPGPTI
jgi:hypothetical protein